MSKKLLNKVAIITGASAGIGQASARALAAEGASIVITARRKLQLETLKKEIEALGGKAAIVIGDAKEEIEVGYEGIDLKIGFNAKYITDVLNAIHDEEVDFEINDQLSPGLMRPHNDKNYTCVVMPMRI